MLRRRLSIAGAVLFGIAGTAGMAVAVNYETEHGWAPGLDATQLENPQATRLSLGIKTKLLEQRRDGKFEINRAKVTITNPNSEPVLALTTAVSFSRTAGDNGSAKLRSLRVTRHGAVPGPDGYAKLSPGGSLVEQFTYRVPAGATTTLGVSLRWSDSQSPLFTSVPIQKQSSRGVS